MLKRIVNTLKPHVRNFHSHSSTPARNGVTLGVISTAVAGTALWYFNAQYIYNDASGPMEPKKQKVQAPGTTGTPSDPNTIYSLIWGSNSNKTILPNSPTSEPIRTPSVAEWLNDVALRDLQFHHTHAACVDARGDVYQWGDGFFGKAFAGVRSPKRTLRGKNIIQLQLTNEKLYALSASGNVYVIATDVLQQELPVGAPTPSSDSWWGTGWFWGEDETVDFAKISPATHLGWRESFVSIAAGTNHLLALTSKGRTYAHPINKKANQYGQLGFRKFKLPNHTAAITSSPSYVDVELIPKSLGDPFWNSSRSERITPATTVSDNLVDVDDSKIRFCLSLFEIPVLRGVDIAQIAAGSRTSFARTRNGRVLGWGANEYGQASLGSNMALDTITVPTEVVLWRMVPNTTRSKCLNVTAGGDLTAFIVERKDDSGPKTVDVLMSGNGQYGGLGNNLYTTAQGNPTRVKGVSGLLQYNDRIRALEPVIPEEISISPTGHVLLALDSSLGVGGRDLMVWGKNYESELGNGKRGSVAVPTPLATEDGERFMLMNMKAKEVKDLQGKLWKRGVKIEQKVATGYGNSAVYWIIAG